MAKKDPLKNIQSNFLGRGFRLAKLTAKVGARAATHGLGKLVQQSGKDPERLKEYFMDQASMLTKELGQLKGSVMKAGQLMSTYGEHFLPPEANDLLKSLQFESPPLVWSELEKSLISELGQERLAELEVDPTPYAAASLGQVHRAKIKATGEQLALKIQYPGVEKAINTDLKFLRLIFQMTDIFPSGFKSKEVMDEIKTMLHQEVDYVNEAKETICFRERLKDHPRIVVPKVFADYSSPRIIATEFQDALPAGDPQIRQWPQETRNEVARLFVEVYVKELFVWGKVQTDPHFGNYRLRLDSDGKPILILLDFGAVREMPATFQSTYRRLASGSFYRRPEDVIAAGRALGFLMDEDPQELLDAFVQLSFMVTEPLSKPEWNSAPKELLNDQGEYDWENSDLPQRVAKSATKIITQFRLRTPPREVVFIDRKLGGTFTFLSRMGCRANVRPWYEPYMEK